MICSLLFYKGKRTCILSFLAYMHTSLLIHISHLHYCFFLLFLLIWIFHEALMVLIVCSHCQKIYAAAGSAIPAHLHQQKQKHSTGLSVNTHTHKHTQTELLVEVLEQPEPLGCVFNVIMVKATTGSAHTLN